MAAAEQFAAHAATARQLANDLKGMGDKQNYVRPVLRSALAAAIAAARFCADTCRWLADQTRGRET